MNCHSKGLVSIIIPCYNQAGFLSQTLNCIKYQAYDNWECIVVNDGSSDNTEKIAQKYCDEDARFRYVYKTNGGLSSARNQGLKEAKGEFIQFLDSDDIIGENKLKRQVEEITARNVDIVLSSCYMFEKSLKFPFLRIDFQHLSTNFHEDILLKWDNEFTIPIHCALLRADFFGEGKILFDEVLKAKEDWYMWFNLSKLTNRVFCDNTCDVYYRWHINSMTKDSLIMLRNQMEAIFKIDSEISDSDLRERFRLTLADKVGKPFQERAFKLGKKIGYIYGAINRPLQGILYYFGLK
ncbi:glycosyltransferase family 2 protein [Plebeiibacterium sediminum]|uniref:Glycosyltransferase n=1 Tax=Plebeiibacterium sediminum TaxID=2992112 RepID=A0AAE3SER2_9BACT|nr:glycosyltransferase family 2 protein [Plebeiobacterium sediminum]MCW3786763.1 glycosyltransferase [Plebeiobacterium sediminum]